METNFKILSLDGGGSWAILQLLTLKERFKEKIPKLNGHAILQEFDLVISNSGGSIVLATLAENWTVDEALNLFRKKEIRDKVFSRNSGKELFWPVRFTRLAGIGPKYSTKRKGEALNQLFPKIASLNMDLLPGFIGKQDLKIVVCSYDALNNRAKFFRSFSHSDKGYSAEYVRLTDAVHGSSNPPIQYFDFPAHIEVSNSNKAYELWDGALGGFNNPVVAGIVEAVRLGESIKDLTVISLGNGNKFMSKDEKESFIQLRRETEEERTKKWKFWKYRVQWKYFLKTIMHQARTILYQPPDWANFVAYMFLMKDMGKNLMNQFIRLSPLIHIDDDTNEDVKPLLEKLYNLDLDLTSDEDIDLIFNCFENWKIGEIKNQPIHYGISEDNNLIPHVGDAFFESGMQKWKKVQ